MHESVNAISTETVGYRTDFRQRTTNGSSTFVSALSAAPTGSPQRNSAQLRVAHLFSSAHARPIKQECGLQGLQRRESKK